MPPVANYKNAVGLMVPWCLGKKLSKHQDFFCSSGSEKHIQLPLSPLIDLGNLQ